MKFLWISVVAVVYSFATNSIDIKGLVQDYAKSPVSGASVSLVGEGLKSETDDKTELRCMFRALFTKIAAFFVIFVIFRGKEPAIWKLSSKYTRIVWRELTRDLFAIFTIKSSGLVKNCILCEGELPWPIRDF